MIGIKINGIKLQQIKSNEMKERGKGSTGSTIKELM
jgi:hypothetical protein